MFGLSNGYSIFIFLLYVSETVGGSGSSTLSSSTAPPPVNSTSLTLPSGNAGTGGTQPRPTSQEEVQKAISQPSTTWKKNDDFGHAFLTIFRGVISPPEPEFHYEGQYPCFVVPTEKDIPIWDKPSLHLSLAEHNFHYVVDLSEIYADEKVSAEVFANQYRDSGLPDLKDMIVLINVTDYNDFSLKVQMAEKLDAYAIVVIPDSSVSTEEKTSEESLRIFAKEIQRKFSVSIPVCILRFELPAAWIKQVSLEGNPVSLHFKTEEDKKQSERENIHQILQAERELTNAEVTHIQREKRRFRESLSPILDGKTFEASGREKMRKKDLSAERIESEIKAFRYLLERKTPLKSFGTPGSPTQLRSTTRNFYFSDWLQNIMFFVFFSVCIFSLILQPSLNHNVIALT